jgi:pimeloyl-ACP methyl ester carboxylesterase
MRTYTHDGLELAYEVQGQGPAVLCVHGATGTGIFEWAELVDALKDSYRVVTPDLRGHGSSEYPRGELTPEAIQGDLVALIGHEDMGRPHVVSFSFGAEVALRMELARPGTAASLTLISPGLGAVRAGAPKPTAQMPSREKLEEVWPRSLRSLHADRHGEDHWLDIMFELWVRHAERPMIELDELVAVDCPVLMVVGEHDDPRRIKQANLFADTNPLARVIVVPDAGHAAHKEQVQVVTRSIRTFLQSPAPAGDEPTQVAGPREPTVRVAPAQADRVVD